LNLLLGAITTGLYQGTMDGFFLALG